MHTAQQQVLAGALMFGHTDEEAELLLEIPAFCILSCGP